MSSISALTVYSIRRDVDGVRVTDFDAAITTKKLEDPTISTRNFVANDWSARLYLWPGEARAPAWLDFVEAGFGPNLVLPATASSSAVIVVKVFFRRDRYYAIAFGGGRYALKRSAIEPKYGLQVALNAIYEGDEGTETLDPANRVQQVNTRTVRANTIRTLRQTNRSADFDVFELDPDGDQLDGITGRPPDESLGRRVRGTDSLRLGRATSFADLGELCRDIARYHERMDYQRRFRFVDDIKEETNAGVIADLQEATTTSLFTDPTQWAIAPPELQDFDEIALFEIPALGISSIEFSAAEIAAAVAASGATTADDLAAITLIGLDDQGDTQYSWSLLSCLDGQVDLDNETFLVDGGRYHKVSEGYINELDAYIGEIPRSELVLPPSKKELVNGELKEISEGEYNDNAANSDPRYLLLDKKLVKVASKTSPIEICDVLTLDGHLIHVKRKFSSSSLSHLFAQGWVSSELLSDNREYRKAIRGEIGPANQAFVDLFPEDGLVTANFEVVYAIVGDWTNKTITDIPFFSKVNLRRYRKALRRLQYKVTYSDVPVVDA